MYTTSGTTPNARGWLRFPRSARGGGGRPYSRRAPELHRRLRAPPPHARTLHVVRPTNGHRTRPTANWVAHGAVPPSAHPCCPYLPTQDSRERETSNPVLSTHPSIHSCLSERRHTQTLHPCRTVSRRSTVPAARGTRRARSRRGVALCRSCSSTQWAPPCCPRWRESAGASSGSYSMVRGPVRAATFWTQRPTALQKPACSGLPSGPGRGEQRALPPLKSADEQLCRGAL